MVRNTNLRKNGVLRETNVRDGGILAKSSAGTRREASGRAIGNSKT